MTVAYEAGLSGRRLVRMVEEHTREEGMTMARLWYHVAPRYTAGSPAMVDQATAERVMAQERSCYSHALEGVYGIAEQHSAEARGLADIVWTTIERRSTLIRHDLMTDVVSQQRIRRDGTLAT